MAHIAGCLALLFTYPPLCVGARGKWHCSSTVLGCTTVRLALVPPVQPTKDMRSEQGGGCLG